VLGEPVDCLGEVVDQQAQMVQPFPVLVQVPPQGMVVTQRLNQLQVQIAQIQMRQPHTRLLDDLAQHQRKTQLVPIEPQGVLGVSYHDGDVI
jgi:hypothetical protein